LTFQDGSTATIPSGMVVRLIQSFRMHDGRYYSLIGIGINETGTVDVQVTPGSRFEVVTPAVIAGVQGTRFRVTTSINNDKYCVNVEVIEGEVAVQNCWVAELPQVLSPGESRRVEMGRKKVVERLPRGWTVRRIHLTDDIQYELPILTTSTDAKK
jgi:hypothetical protein